MTCLAHILPSDRTSEEEWAQFENLLDRLPALSLSDAKNDQSDLAAQIRIQSKVFPTEEEATSHFQNLLIYNRKMQECQKRLQELEACSTSALTVAENEIHKQEIKSVEDMIWFCNSNIQELNRVTAITNNLYCLPIRSVLNLSRCTADPDPQVRKVAETACKVLQVYNDIVLEVLTHTDANMEQKDLLFYCIGPRALFAYYEFSPQISSRRKHDGSEEKSYMFTHPSSTNWPVPFFFGLDEDTPDGLEELMRNRLVTNGAKSLPPRLITERVCTKIVTSREERVKSVTIPIFNNWEKATDADKEVVANELIAFNNWGAFDITSSHIKIKVISPEQVQGVICKGEREKPFRMKMKDFYLLVPRNSSDADVDRLSTRKVLRDWKEVSDHESSEAHLPKCKRSTCGYHNLGLDDK